MYLRVYTFGEKQVGTRRIRVKIKVKGVRVKIISNIGIKVRKKFQIFIAYSCDFFYGTFVCGIVYNRSETSQVFVIITQQD